MESGKEILSKVSQLEELPNELFFWIFSYLKSDMVIQAFIDLNQRFEAIIRQYARHLVFSSDSEFHWIKQHMMLIKDEIETMILSVQLIAAVFSRRYSYPNLRSITIYSDIAWQVELNVENELPGPIVVSALRVLKECYLENTQQDFSRMLKTIRSAQVAQNILSTAIRRVTIFPCHEGCLWNLCGMAPELTHLKVWLRPSRTMSYYTAALPSKIIRPTRLIELHVKITDAQSIGNINLLIDCCQGSLRRIILDLGTDLGIDGRKLETMLAPCTFLEHVSFISQFSKTEISTSNLLRSFQSEWWLATERPAVLIHETDLYYMLAMSMPCSFSKILRRVQFSSDLNSWHLNKGKLDTLPIGSIKTNKIFLSSKRPISLDFLRFTARIFHSQKQTLACRRWGLMFEEECFEKFMNQSSTDTVLPTLTRLNLAFVNGLSPLTLATWLLLAPNVWMLEIEYLTFGEMMQWATELQDALMMGDQRLKMVFQRIQRITVSALCYNYNEQSKPKIYTILTKIFPVAAIS